MGNTTKLSKELESVIIEKWKCGYNGVEIAKHLHIYASTATRVVNEYIENGELDDSAHKRLLESVDKGKLVALYKAGWPIKEIAADLKVDDYVVLKTLEKEEIICG